MVVSRDKKPVVHPLPPIEIDAFFETKPVSIILDEVKKDRHLLNATMRIHQHGIPGAINFFEGTQSAHLIIMETRVHREQIVKELLELAEYCSAESEVIIIGHINDIDLYKDLQNLGVSSYLTAPVSSNEIVSVMNQIFFGPQKENISLDQSSYSVFCGAKGGVGSSTICHNVAHSLANDLNKQVLMADFDFKKGSSMMSFNQVMPFDPKRLAKAIINQDFKTIQESIFYGTTTLQLFIPQISLTEENEFGIEHAHSLTKYFTSISEHTIIDLPCYWNEWHLDLICNAHNVFLVAEPDLISLRNIKLIMQTLYDKRGSLDGVNYILNNVESFDRTELSAQNFSNMLQMAPVATIPSEPDAFSEALKKSACVITQTSLLSVINPIKYLASIICGEKFEKDNSNFVNQFIKTIEVYGNTLKTKIKKRK